MIPHTPLSFRAQLVVICCACVAIAALAILVIYDAYAASERALVDEARHQCATAANELKRQFVERVAAEPLEDLPPNAQDVSLRGISTIVLRGYEDIEGGYFRVGAGVLGYSESNLSDSDSVRLAQILSQTRQPRTTVEELWEGSPVVVAAEVLDTGEIIAWALKRVRPLHNTRALSRTIWVGALLAVSLLGVAAIVSIWFALRSGLIYVREGLHKLEHDFTHRLKIRNDDFGEIAAAINQMADRRAALETELRAQDRHAALGRVVAGVAHEVRNPLNSMRLTLELFKRRSQRGVPPSGEIDQAISQIDRLNAIVSRLLAFGRPPLEGRRMQPLQPVIDRAVAIVREQSRQKDLIISADAGGASGDFDAAQLEQVIINLLLNAIHASPPAGEIAIRAMVAEDRLTVLVSDQGQGVAATAQAHVFDAYFSTKPEGNGLGLAVSREIVRNHGGDLRFETSAAGATFIIDLPAAGASANASGGGAR